MKALLMLLALGGIAVARPAIKVPTLKEAMAGDLVGRAKIRWSKIVDGKRVQVTISGGEVERLEPGWSDKPGRIPYDLNRNRTLARALQNAKLPAAQKRLSEVIGDRSLELLVDGPEDFVVIAVWSMSEKLWQKKYGALFDLLEPLFKVQIDTFGTLPGPEK